MYSIDIPEIAWTPVGEDEDDYDPRLHLLASIAINGLMHHVDAFAVHVVDDMQKTINPHEQEDFNQWYQAAHADGHVRTIRLYGYDYAVFASPFC